MTGGIFVTGTDTGVGKTFFTAGLALALRKRGIRTGIMKPVETGEDSDAYFLKDMLCIEDDTDLINPYHFNLPLSPLASSMEKGIEINIDVIKAKYTELKKRYEILLVEGAGGLLCPIKKNFFISDLIKILRIPLIIVSRSGLGTVNHTLLTVNWARYLNLDISGIVINHLIKDPGIQEKSSIEILEILLDVPILGIIPYCVEARTTGNVLSDVIEGNVDVSLILKKCSG